MAIPQVLKDYTAFADGFGYLGKVPELELPKITKVVQEFRAGGMAGTAEIFMAEVEKMEANLTLAEYNVQNLKLFGITNGSDVSVTFRGAQQGGGETVPIIVNMRGEYKEMEMGSWKKGEDAQLKAVFSLTYYKLNIGGEDLIEIDVVNGTLIAGGNDLRAEINSALGK